ncbi:hypothetical protein [Sinorhizobium meliloti]|nr:hypothetical protein [Sinorhizobium meliloti]
MNDNDSTQATKGATNQFVVVHNRDDALLSAHPSFITHGLP